MTKLSFDLERKRIASERDTAGSRQDQLPILVPADMSRWRLLLHFYTMRRCEHDWMGCFPESRSALLLILVVSAHYTHTTAPELFKQYSGGVVETTGNFA